MESWFIKNVRGTFNLKQWLKDFHSSGSSKPFMLLTGEKNVKSIHKDNHMSYLWRFNHKTAIITILNRINSTKIWIKPTAHIFNDFEDVYNYVWNKINIPPIPNIGQLAIYDISLHLAWLWGDKNLLPSKYVYVHALPYRSYRRLVNEKIFTKISIKKGRIDIKSFHPYFPNLQADEIEDLLCHIGKSIRKIDKIGGIVSVPNIIANL